MKPKIHKWRFSGKYWQFQLLGWTIYLFNELSGAWNSLSFSATFLLRFITTFAILYGLLEVVRIFYRRAYKRIANPAIYLLMASLFSFICSFFWTEIRVILDVVVFHTKASWVHSTRDFNYLAGIIKGTWVPFVWSILYFGIKYWQDLVIEKDRARNAILLAQRAQLQMLRYQLNPHFLFNSLNSIQALIHENPEQADDMVSELSDFLRYTLQYNNRIMIYIREEVDITLKYLNIEKIRYEERLNFEISADEGVLDMKIPCFITQPLVENSIKHGLLNNSDGINLKLRIFTDSRRLKIQVSNNGSLTGDWTKGTGLKNVMERLENTYAEYCRFSITEKEGYVIAEITIPIENEKINIIDN